MGAGGDLGRLARRVPLGDAARSAGRFLPLSFPSMGASFGRTFGDLDAGTAHARSPLGRLDRPCADRRGTYLYFFRKSLSGCLGPTARDRHDGRALGRGRARCGLASAPSRHGLCGAHFLCALSLALARSHPVTALRGAYAGWWEAAAWMALSVALAWASWAAIEQPVRRGRLASPRALLGFVITASGAAMAFGVLAYLKDGVPGRFGPEARVHIAASDDFLQDFSRCTTPEEDPFTGLEICPLGPDGPPQVLVWGDSHLRALYEGLRLAAEDTPALAIWRAGCPPLFGITKSENSASPAEDAACAAANARIETAIAGMPSLARVLLIGRWNYYASGTGIGLDAENRIAVSHPTSGRTGGPALDAAVTQTVETFRTARLPVFVLTQPPNSPPMTAALPPKKPRIGAGRWPRRR